jgi:hypothetical protein
MAYTVHRFPVKFARPHDEINLALRIATAFEFRSAFRSKFAAGVAAGADKDMISQKFTFVLQAARKASRLTRAVPFSLLQWAGFVEYHRDAEEYPQPIDESIGSFNTSSLVSMPGGVYMVEFGGISLVGNYTGAVNQGEISEIRLERLGDPRGGTDTYNAVIVCGRPESGPREALPEPQPRAEIDA